MKKIIFSLIFVMCVCLLTGCGDSTKKLNCSIDASKLISVPSGLTIIQDNNVDFKNDKIQSVEMIFKVDIDSSLKDYASTYYNNFKSTYENLYGVYDGVTVTTNKKSDLAFDIVVSIDFKKISDSTKKALNMQGSESYNLNKKQLENLGYTCK